MQAFLEPCVCTKTQAWSPEAHRNFLVAKGPGKISKTRTEMFATVVLGLGLNWGWGDNTKNREK